MLLPPGKLALRRAEACLFFFFPVRVRHSRQQIPKTATEQSLRSPAGPARASSRAVLLAKQLCQHQITTLSATLSARDLQLCQREITTDENQEEKIYR